MALSVDAVALHRRGWQEAGEQAYERLADWDAVGPESVRREMDTALPPPLLAIVLGYVPPRGCSGQHTAVGTVSVTVLERMHSLLRPFPDPFLVELGDTLWHVRRAIVYRQARQLELGDGAVANPRNDWRALPAAFSFLFGPHVVTKDFERFWPAGDVTRRDVLFLWDAKEEEDA
jgi:hypothetical protein